MSSRIQKDKNKVTSVPKYHVMMCARKDKNYSRTK
jgi:hypothetical protein